MKKAILIAAVAALCASASAQTLKFAHIDSQELMFVLPETEKVQDELAAAQQETAETYQSMVEEYQTKAQQYEAKKATWTPSILQSKEKELQDMVQRIQEFERSAQQELQELQQQKMAPIQEKVAKAIDEVAKEGGFIFVFEKGGLIYVDDAQSTDILPAVRKKLGVPEDRTVESVSAAYQAKAAAAQK